MPAKPYASPGPPPAEALEYFRAKGLKVGFHHTDVWREEHASAFTVAKAMEEDVLTAIRAEVDRCLAEGRTFRDFAKALQPHLKEMGWWGRKEMVDPITGEVRKVQLGSPQRLRTIFNTNMRTARAAGQWERIQRTRATHPYLLYELGPSERHRPEHVGWAGTMLPVDDPWWGSHFPPNGWGCKCRARQVSRAEAARLERDGVPPLVPEQEKDPDTGLPTGHFVPGKNVPVRRQAPPSRAREWKNLRTGEVHQVPVGIDPGWDYNPGQAGRLAKSLELATEKLEAAHAADANAMLGELVGSPTFESWLAAPRGDFPVLRLPDAAAQAIGAKRRVAVFSPDSAAKNVSHHPEVALEDYRELPVMGAAPTVVVQDGENSVVIVRRGKQLYWAAVKATATGQGTFLTSFRRTNRAGVRALLKRGKAVYGAWDE